MKFKRNIPINWFFPGARARFTNLSRIRRSEAVIIRDLLRGFAVNKGIVTAIGIALTTVTLVTQANMEVRFVESAPKDWFSFTNRSDCDLADITVTVDLSDSVGQLIFDTTGNGAGVEVFQPFEVREGSIKLDPGSDVVDGDRMLVVIIDTLAAGGTASFTIDVDDTLPSSELGQIRVARSEINKARVTVKIEDRQPAEALFDESSQATVMIAQCREA